MGWNCPECGKILRPEGKLETVRAKSGMYEASYEVCDHCGAEYVGVFRSSGTIGNYVGLLRLPEPKERTDITEVKCECGRVYRLPDNKEEVFAWTCQGCEQRYEIENGILTLKQLEETEE